MPSSISARLRRLRLEQRALRHDLIRWMGRPRVFWIALGSSAVLSFALTALPEWISALLVIGLLTGFWRAGDGRSIGSAHRSARTDLNLPERREEGETLDR